MRIGIDALPLTAPMTGVGHYTFELATALARTQPHSQFELVYPSNYPEIQLQNLDDMPNLRLQRVKVGAVGRRWFAAGLPRYLRRAGIDLFHGTNYEVPLWRLCASVLTIHDLSHYFHPDTHEPRRVKRSRRRLPLMVRNADAIITPSDTVRAQVCEVFGVRPELVFAIPEAARTTFYPVAVEQSAPRLERLGIGEDFFLAVGTLEPRKNLSVLVAAFAKLAAENGQNSSQLVIAGGKGWLTDPLFEQIRHSQLGDRIVLTDYLQDEDLRALYSSCRAFIYPSIYEGFGLPPLEAMACGAPVVASQIGAHEETSQGSARLFDPKNSDQLAQILLELSTDQSAREALSQKGKLRAAEFSWEKTAEMTWQVYEKAFEWFSSK
jgi:glycosyltransferase involved in cell wall biosynthesis